MGEWGDTPHAKLQSPRYVASPSMDLLDFPSSKMSLSSYIGRRERWISAGEERHNIILLFTLLRSSPSRT